MVKFYSEDEPEKAHADYLKFQKWVKTKHRTKAEGDKKNNIESVVCVYADVIKDSGSNDYHFKWYDADGMLCFYAHWVKWYESYAGVQWHEQLLDEVSQYPTGGYRFIRIGEEDEDTEVRGYNNGHTDLFEKLYMNRSIEFHPPCETEDKEAT